MSNQQSIIIVGNQKSHGTRATELERILRKGIPMKYLLNGMIKHTGPATFEWTVS